MLRIPKLGKCSRKYCVYRANTDHAVSNSQMAKAAKAEKICNSAGSIDILVFSNDFPQ